MDSPSIMFVAGDPSGDKHASWIVKRLKAELPLSDIWGIGGPDMQAAGLHSLLPFKKFNKMGFFEVALHIFFFLNAKKFLINEIKRRRPGCLVCVDYPGFNMELLKAASSMNIPVVWYIAPMVWAWKEKRAQILAEKAAHIACIFPFEVNYFKPYTSHVSFVGNPIVEAMNNDKAPRKNYTGKPKRLALVPGSRRQEIKHLLPHMIEAYTLLKKKYPELTVEVSKCSYLSDEEFSEYTQGSDLTLFSGPLHELYSRSDFAIVTSGTATLEAALMGVPHVIAYKTSPVNYQLFKHFLKIPFIGLPNIISQEMIVPECIQNDATGASIAEAVEVFLKDDSYYKMTASKLLLLKNHLGAFKPSEELVKIIRNCITPKAS
ncbi:MAG TPA: lipid-A-disaccharide synthase [Chitinispirillaceae bacterium]|nr:lipid-A-disaccharide synthase [Chitinispirillaceae bacterium]